MKANQNSFQFTIPGRGSLRVLWAFSVLAAIAGLGISVIVDSTKACVENQLASEVCALNAALEVHRIFHGELETPSSVDEALAQLQDFSEKGAVIDHRLRAEIQNSEDAASGAPRAIWNRMTKRFEIVHGEVRGVKRFYLDENPEPVRLAEKRRIDKLDFEASDSWIWNHEDGANPVVAPLTMHSSKLAASAKR